MCREKNRLHPAGGRRRIFCTVLAGAMLLGQPAAALATSREEMQQELDQARQGLDEAERQADEAENNRRQAQQEVEKLNDEMTDLLMVISLLESDMKTQEDRIAQAQADYEAARQREQEQYEAMKLRIKYMYERGETEFLDVLLKVKSMSELLNKSEYIESIYNYDREKLIEFQETKRQVEEYQNQLDSEMAEMEAMKLEYKEQQEILEEKIAEGRQKVADFDAQYARAQQAAADYTRTIEEKNEQIRKAEEEERRRREEEERRRREEEEAARQAAERAAAAASATIAPSPGGSAGDASSTAASAPTVYRAVGGTELGRQIADYGLQFVGNKYVYGGTSLTNGTDCSGFTQSIYKHFGYSIPRTSYDQRFVGTEVSYSDAQPGDIICYPGHVALYIGDGKIVHASNSRVGIIVSNATYRSMLTVRRIIN